MTPMGVAMSSNSEKIENRWLMSANVNLAADVLIRDMWLLAIRSMAIMEAKVPRRPFVIVRIRGRI